MRLEETLQYKAPAIRSGDRAGASGGVNGKDGNEQADRGGQALPPDGRPGGFHCVRRQCQQVRSQLCHVAHQFGVSCTGPHEFKKSRMHKATICAA